jgi:hypothetical protein
MAFWSRKPGEEGGLDLSLTNILIIVVMTLVLIQGLGIIFVKYSWGNSIKLGPVFILIAISMSAAVNIALFKKLANDMPLDKQDVFAVVLVTGIALLMLFFLRDFVPEIFSGSVLQLQSMLGFG